MFTGCISPEDVIGVLKRNPTKMLKLFHMNARSLRQKWDDVTQLLDSCQTNFDVLMFTETWYKNDDHHFVLPGCTHFFLNRPEGRGGGVSIQTRLLSCDVIQDFSVITANYEILCIANNKNIFAVLYRPPSGSLPAFFAFFDRLLSYASEKNCCLIVGGDLNINLLKNTAPATELSSIIQSNGFTNVITSPTRVTSTTASLLDVFITNYATEYTTSGVLSTDISDHMPIFFITDSQDSERCKNRDAFTYRLITPNTLEDFRKRIVETNWANVLAVTDANIAYESFIKIFKSHYFNSFPIQTHRTPRKSRKPWITGYLRKQIAKKNKLYHSFVKTGDSKKWDKYKSFRNNLNKEKEKMKREYYSRIFDASCLKRSDIVWRRLNELLSKRSCCTPIDRLKVQDKILSGTDLAEKFNDFFVELGDAGNLNQTAQNTESLPNTIFLQPTCMREVIDTTTKFKNSHSSDVDGLQIRPIKYVLDLLAEVLTHIYNVALSSGVFPEGMQIAKVSVIHKGGEKNELANYRPISVLPVFSKCLEKIICNQIEFFSRKHKLITDCQFGFRKNRSTESALLMQKDTILENFEKRLLTLGIYLDFSKAFDRVNHVLLLNKLQNYGFRGVAYSLMQSYLLTRSQCVEVNNRRSRTKPLKTGVPQGSILGPILFLFYINDITRIQTNCKFIIYADDCTLFVSGNNLETIVPVSSSLCYAIQKWSQNNCLTLNESKTKGVLFRPLGTAAVVPDSIVFGPYKITMVKSVKTLGVIFTEHMSWNEHVNSLCLKAQKAAGIINRCRHFLPTGVKRLLYQALFHSHLNYCALVWANTTLNNIHKITTLQKKAIRAVENVPFQAHTKELFQKHRILRAENIYRYKLIRSYRYAKQSQLDTFIDLAHLEETVHVYTHRYKPPWKIPSSRTNYGQQLLRHTLPSTLNYFHKQEIDILVLKDDRIIDIFI